MSQSTVTQARPEPPARGTLHAAMKRFLGLGFALAGIGLILWLDNWFMAHVDMPDLGQNMGYGLLFLVGVLTSFHCVGMCGPLIVGYTANEATQGIKSHFSHLQYGIGKTASYTAIGAVCGAFGSILAFTPQTQGLVGIAAGAFLILFGLHMLNAFVGLRHFYIKPPRFFTRLVGRGYRKHRNPLVIGLLNGLMIICGPLQAMYVMAAGSGSWIEGGRIMFFFGLGTLPLLMGFGLLTSLASANLTPKLLKASGVIVIVLGAIMLNRGMALAGSGWDFNAMMARVSNYLAPGLPETPLCDLEQTIRMEIVSGKFVPNHFVLKKGVPVKWVIEGKELNKCNQSLVVPSYDLKFDVHPGLQTIEFTPKEAGVISWSCWMGMIPGSFMVVDEPVAGETDQRPFYQRWGDDLNRLIALWVSQGDHIVAWVRGLAEPRRGEEESTQ
ncbi:MAG: sulfite exporter TauE/SafE family protein [Methylococcus sp.]